MGPEKPYHGFSIDLGHGEIYGADRIRTDDLLRARQALFQLSYDPDSNAMNPKEARMSNRYYPRASGPKDWAQKC